MATKTEKQLRLADTGMLDKIDKLFACNVGHYISLPQIVVVGNQSSGKSSVLEGLTSLPFPKDSGLCTRFATQITFKRSTEASISVMIIPAKDAPIEHAGRCRAWKKTLHALNKDEFIQIMTEVNDVMGISAGASPPKTFSEDVLSIEVSGPEEEHLSVIDVPGIFKKTTEGVTTKADMAMVNAMVESYVKNPRSIILAVVPANVDIATQEILDIAEKHDPEGARTLGVLTKPDLVDEGAEQMILDLLNDRSHKLALGWCILRNLGQKETENSQDRHFLETIFFATKFPWTQVEKSKAGIEALRIRLGRLLVQHTRREFPKVKQELDKLLKSSREKLEGLGPQRTSTAEQASYLIQIASDFQVKTSWALNATYYADACFDAHPSLRLANNIVTRNEQFADTLEKSGHQYAFKSSLTPDDFEVESVADNIDFGEGFTRTIDAQLVDIEDIIDEKHSHTHPNDHGIAVWLMKLYDESRGFEIGTFDPKLLAHTMKVQSAKWPGICRGYVSDVVCLTHQYILDMVNHLCPDDRVQGELLGILMERILQGYKNALNHVDLVLSIERSVKPTTQNHYFNENLQKCREKRVTDALDAIQAHHGKDGTEYLDKVQAAAKVQQSMSNTRHIVQEIHDILKSYYKVARKRVVDVIIMQAVDFHLLSGPKSPLRVLSPEFIGTLTNEQLERIAGEDEFTRTRRAELKKTITELEKGKKILQSA